MGILDAPMAAVAKTLTGTFGRPATLKVYLPPLYDDSTGATSSGTPTEVSCSVVLSEYTDHQIDGTLIKAGDRKAIVSRSEIATKPVPDRDTLVIGSETWRIVRVTGYSSGESEAAYELQLRR